MTENRPKFDDDGSLFLYYRPDDDIRRQAEQNADCWLVEIDADAPINREDHGGIAYVQAWVQVGHTDFGDDTNALESPRPGTANSGPLEATSDGDGRCSGRD